MTPKHCHAVAGEAEAHYGDSTKPYLLAHLQPSAAASQAAARAKPHLPAALRWVADFYVAQNGHKRQAALDELLLLLQAVLQQQYSALWGADAIVVLLIKVQEQRKQHFALLNLHIFSCHRSVAA